MTNIYAALEIGTTRTVLAIGEAESGGRLKVTCHAEIPSSGVRKSQILDIRHATESIRSVLAEIEKKQDAIGSKITIGNAFLAVSGQHVETDVTNGTAQLEGSKVSSSDIHEAMRSSRQQVVLAKDRELLDIIDQDFMLDNRGGISSPKGMAGRVLRLNTLLIHASRNSIQDARSAADAAHLEIREPLFAVTCAADAVLHDYEKKNGVLVIDIGGGTTGYAVYSDNYLVSAGVIGVGGDHITNDIAHAFSTTNAQAEEIKIKEASATPISSETGSARVKIPGSNPLMETRTISRKALDTVVNARVKELFAILREKLEAEDLLHRLHSGAVITGGGAGLKDIDMVIRHELGMDVRHGTPIHVDGLADEVAPESFATIAGTLLYAHRNYEEKSFIDSLFGRFFK